MGADGGVVATKRKFTRIKKKHSERVDKSEIRIARVTHCAISNDPLTFPVVACEMGGLYNKEVVLKALLERTLPAELKHIRSMKSLVDCKFTPNNKAMEKEAKSGSHMDPSLPGAFCCPITYLPMNGKHSFCVIKSCGCVLSLRALEELPSDNCLKCQKPFSAKDVIILCPMTDEEEKHNKSRLTARRRERKAKRKVRGEQPSAKPLHRRKRKREEAEAGPSISSGALSSRALSLADAVVEKKQAESSTFASLFRKREEADAAPKGNSLFIREAAPAFGMFRGDL